MQKPKWLLPGRQLLQREHQKGRPNPSICHLREFVIYSRPCPRRVSRGVRAAVLLTPFPEDPLDPLNPLNPDESSKIVDFADRRGTLNLMTLQECAHGPTAQGPWALSP